MIWLLFPLAIISGILGRMGGANGWNTKYRDIGCSIVLVVSVVLFVGKGVEFWWVYATMFLAMWGALSTYWDWMWTYDNMAFSGFMVGIAATPLLVIDLSLWWLVALRAVALASIWWALNRYRRPVWIWKEDVVEEFLRYAISL